MTPEEIDNVALTVVFDHLDGLVDHLDGVVDFLDISENDDVPDDVSDLKEIIKQIQKRLDALIRRNNELVIEDK